MTGGTGNSLRAIAGRYSLAKSSLDRHKHNCMGERAALATVVRDRVAARGEAAITATAEHGATVVRSVLARAESVLRPMTSMLERMAAAEEVATGDELRDLRAEYRQTAKVALEFFRTIGQASGEIPNAQTNILVANIGDVLGNPSHPVTLAWEGALADVREAGEAAALAAFELGARGRPATEAVALRAELPQVVAEARRMALGAHRSALDVVGEPVE